jgi:hypothetical protein
MAARYQRGEGMVLKTEVVRVRLTKQEKVLLQERAEKLNMSMSDYIKYCCLINPPIKQEEIDCQS